MIIRVESPQISPSGCGRFVSLLEPEVAVEALLFPGSSASGLAGNLGGYPHLKASSIVPRLFRSLFPF